MRDEFLDPAGDHLDATDALDEVGLRPRRLDEFVGQRELKEKLSIVLQAARAAGVRIGAACESGLCGTCKVMKLSGEVEMDHNGGILDDEIDEGYILACCSRPKGDIEIEA